MAEPPHGFFQQATKACNHPEPNAHKEILKGSDCLHFVSYGPHAHKASGTGVRRTNDVNVLSIPSVKPAKRTSEDA